MKLFLRTLALVAPLALFACSEPPTAGGSSSSDDGGSAGTGGSGGAAPLPLGTTLFKGRVLAEGDLQVADRSCFFVTVRYFDESTPETGVVWLVRQHKIGDPAIEQVEGATTLEFSLGPGDNMMGAQGPREGARFSLKVTWSPEGVVELTDGARSRTIDVELNDMGIEFDLPADE